MGSHGTGQEVVARIAFAEQWLQRARGQVSGGQLTRGVLTLVLADAEVHHAMEVAGLPGRPARHLRPALAVLLVGLVVAVALGLARSAAGPAPSAVDAGPPVLRLAGPGDDLLRITAPPAVVPAATVTTPRAAVRPAAPLTVTNTPAGVPAPPAVASMPPASPPPAPTVVTAAADGGPAPPASAGIGSVPPPVTVLSPGDLIDLVLAAERALRADPMRR